MTLHKQQYDIILLITALKLPNLSLLSKAHLKVRVSIQSYKKPHNNTIYTLPHNIQPQACDQYCSASLFALQRTIAGGSNRTFDIQLMDLKSVFEQLIFQRVPLIGIIYISSFPPCLIQALASMWKTVDTSCSTTARVTP